MQHEELISGTWDIGLTWESSADHYLGKWKRDPLVHKDAFFTRLKCLQVISKGFPDLGGACSFHKILQNIPISFLFTHVHLQIRKIQTEEKSGLTYSYNTGTNKGTVMAREGKELMGERDVTGFSI